MLEEKHMPIGLPQGIVCLRWYNVRVQGVPNHAGPTPMGSRHDAVYAFSLMAARIFEIAHNSGQVVATVGEIHASPNSRNVIAGDVQFTIDVRGWDEASTDEVCQHIETALAEAAQQAGCQVMPERIWQVSRVPFDQRLREMVREASSGLGLPCLDMVSGASHDMIYIAQVVPGAMIFVPASAGAAMPRLRTPPGRTVQRAQMCCCNACCARATKQTKPTTACSKHLFHAASLEHRAYTALRRQTTHMNFRHFLRPGHAMPRPSLFHPPLSRLINFRALYFCINADSYKIFEFLLGR